MSGFRTAVTPNGFAPAFGATANALPMRHAAGRGTSPKVVFSLALFFLIGWVTEDWSLFDVGKYSVPLLYLAALPLCIRLTGRSVCIVLLPLASSLLAALVGLMEGVEKMHIISQGTLQLLALVFAAGVASINWRRHFHALTRSLVVVATPVVVYGGYQMVARVAHWRFAFLTVTNQQEYATGGYQRGFEKPVFTRASSLFVEPASFGYFCLWLLVLGLSLKKGPYRYLALTLTFSGILFSQSLSAVLGAGIVLIAYLFTNRINFEVIRQIIVISLLLGIALVTVPPLMPEAYAKFSERIQQALSLDERADSSRVDHLPANLRILGEAPIWGHGLASLSVDGANLDITTIAYALVPMERGFVGALLYFAPWFYVTWRALRLPRTDSARTPAVLLCALHLYIFATSSVLYFLPYWFAFAVTASLVLRTHRPSRTASVPRLWNDMPDLNPPDSFLL